jgi:hypothetical protein
MAPSMPRKLAARGRMPPQPAQSWRLLCSTTIIVPLPPASITPLHKWRRVTRPSSGPSFTVKTRPAILRVVDNRAIPQTVPWIERASRASETAGVSRWPRRAIRSDPSSRSFPGCKAHPRSGTRRSAIPRVVLHPSEFKSLNRASRTDPVSNLRTPRVEFVPRN